ncbi:ATP-binding protein [Streptococcus iniae]|uniref:ATP-binding protein n=1 Tax=Streptococcus iniae TaxID=1346 RepID=UPI00273E8154|nr:ATP-binding protein [Streptococcus iniae]WLR88555.1 ATP-binding protein [Streptococcus iniae]
MLLEQMGLTAGVDYKGMIASGFLVDSGETCEKHSAPIFIRTRPEHCKGKFCWACQTESRDAKKQKVDLDAENKAMLARGYEVFKRESILSEEQARADFKNFAVSNKTDQEVLNYGKRVVRDYLKGMNGNSVLKGPTGAGKSHISMSIAKQLNESFKAYKQEKSVIFVSVSRLVQLVQDSFNVKGSRYTAERMTKLLTECDFLVLDDLGKESTTGNNIKPASDWTYRFLFNILDARENTIINTNFTVKELKSIYDDAFVSRVLKGAKNNIFSYPDSAESKRF